MVASAAAHESGLPPNVVVCRKGLSNRTENTSSVAMVAPIGITPPPSALARHRMSGCTFSCSQANILPVRPMPVCTSSRIISAPNSSQSLRTAVKYPCGGRITPPSPWIGSRITAATSSPVFLHSLRTVRMASISPKGTWRKPGSSGINGLRKVDLAVADSDPSDLPWKAPLVAINVNLPRGD